MSIAFKRMNLVIVGGQKCGTTALAHFLSQHPDIFVVNGKEAHVFDDPMFETLTDKDIDDRYKTLMEGYAGEQWVCDATPIYSYWEQIPEKLMKYNPEMKAIFMVRNPVDRAISHYFMEQGRGDERLGILRAFWVENKRLLADKGDSSWGSSWRHHSYLDRGFFSSQIDRLKRVFSAEKLLVITNDQLLIEHKLTLSSIFHFLGVDFALIAEEKIFQGSYRTEGYQVRIARLYAAWRLRRERSRLKEFHGITID